MTNSTVITRMVMHMMVKMQVYLKALQMTQARTKITKMTVHCV